MRITQARPLDASSSGNTASSTGGAELLLTLPATTAGKRNYLSSVHWFVGAAAAGQNLRVLAGTSSGAQLLRVGVSSGNGSLQLGALRGPANTAMTVILSTGGSTHADLCAYGFTDE